MLASLPEHAHASASPQALCKLANQLCAQLHDVKLSQHSFLLHTWYSQPFCCSACCSAPSARLQISSVPTLFSGRVDRFTCTIHCANPAYLFNFLMSKLYSDFSCNGCTVLKDQTRLILNQTQLCELTHQQAGTNQT